MIFIALGSNLPSRFGGPEGTLAAAMLEMERSGISILQASSVWISEPVPKSDQPHYRNSVISVETALSAQELLRVLQDIEAEFGRVRLERNAARPLDLDIIAYHDKVSDEEGLTLPHPRMQERGFVLFPLCEISPGWRHPVTRCTAKELLDALAPGQVLYRSERVAA